MKIKQTIKTILIGAFIFVGGVALSPSAFAQSTPTTTTTTTTPAPSTGSECGGVKTAIIKCDQTGKGGTSDTGLWGVLIIAINILTAGVGVAALGGIIYGAVLYTSAGGSQEQVKKAMTIITNVVIGVVVYAVMFSGLNFLIPGGLFN